MENTVISTESWLIEELKMINGKMAATLNGRMEASLYACDDSSREITLQFPLKDWEVNGIGTLHGGMASTMLDLTMSMVIYAYARQSVPPTISMTTNYLRPIPMEGSVLVKARVTSLGRKNGTAYSEVIIPSSGKVACTAIGTYAIVPKKEG